jgi:membrane protease YdiL (CAAX protease family)
MDFIINSITVGLFVCAAVVSDKNKNKISIIELNKIKPDKHTKYDVIAGIFIGLLAMVGIFLIDLKQEYISVQRINYMNISLILLFFKIVLAALQEELIFRAFMLNGLIKLSKNKYLAVIITAVFFGLAHASNPNATAISVISNGLGGVMYSIAFIESGSIWLPFGLHFAWNFFQGPILGFPVSGFNFGGIVQQSFIAGKDIFTGGAYGPEGGLIGISFRFFVIIMLFLYYYLCIKKRDDSTQNIGQSV